MQDDDFDFMQYPDFFGVFGFEDEFEADDADGDAEDTVLECPFLPLRDMVLFPQMVMPLFVGRDRSLAAVQAADPSILATLSGSGPYTVFAPTDAAFAAALESLGLSAEELLADTDLLNTVLAYHVVPGSFPAETVIAAAGDSGANVATLLSGNSLSLMVADGAVMVNDATVVAADVAASNGIVHIIDGVLLPPME